MEYSDNKLIADYLNGDEEALEVLIKRYLKPIFSFAYRYTDNVQEAEDISQTVFVKVWQNLKRFDQKKSFKTWIFTIAKNKCIDFLRKKKTVLFSNFENEKRENSFVEKLKDSSPLPDEIFEAHNLKEKLNLAINKLSPKNKAVLILRYNDHFTFKEIAEVLNEPLNTVKSRHNRALVLLRKLI